MNDWFYSPSPLGHSHQQLHILLCELSTDLWVINVHIPSRLLRCEPRLPSFINKMPFEHWVNTKEYRNGFGEESPGKGSSEGTGA